MIRVWELKVSTFLVALIGAAKLGASDQKTGRSRESGIYRIDG